MHSYDHIVLVLEYVLSVACLKGEALAGQRHEKTFTSLADPFEELGLPLFIEEVLQQGAARCIAFNHWGTVLAGTLRTSLVTRLRTQNVVVLSLRGTTREVRGQGLYSGLREATLRHWSRKHSRAPPPAI